MSLVGRVIKDRYEIERLISPDGCQAEVYGAKDLVNHEYVALKISRGTALGSYDRSEREVLIYKSIPADRNIVPLLDSGQFKDNGELKVYCVFPFIGCSLEKIIADRSGKCINGSDVDLVSETIELCAHMASGLAKLHAHSVVHRDIKSGNIMIEVDAKGAKTALVMDFGIAWREGVSEPFAANLTMVQHFVGTPQNMAPQQAFGAGVSKEADKLRLDPRNDVYSLGTVIFEAFAGRLPILVDSQETFDKVLTGERRAISLRDFCCGLPEELVDMVARCLSYEIENRPQASEVLACLLRLKYRKPSAEQIKKLDKLGPITFKTRTPGSTRVSGDAETMFAPSTPPDARKSDPKVSVDKLKSRFWMAFIPLMLAALVGIGWILFSDAFEQRTGMVVGPMNFGSALAPSTPVSVQATASVSVSATASVKPSGQSPPPGQSPLGSGRAEPKPKPKVKPLPGPPRVDWSPPATGDQPLDPGLPGPPM